MVILRGFAVCVGLIPSRLEGQGLARASAVLPNSATSVTNMFSRLSEEHVTRIAGELDRGDIKSN